MCARPGYQPRAKVFESYPRRHPGGSSYAYDPPSLFLSHEFYPPRFSKNPPQNSAEREIFLESFSFPRRLLSAETDFARIPSYEQSFVSSEIAGRSPTINGESVPRFTITKQILISRLPSIVQGLFTPFLPEKPPTKWWSREKSITRSVQRSRRLNRLSRYSSTIEFPATQPESSNALSPSNKGNTPLPQFSLSPRQSSFLFPKKKRNCNSNSTVSPRIIPLEYRTRFNVVSAHGHRCCGEEERRWELVIVNNFRIDTVCFARSRRARPS